MKIIVLNTLKELNNRVHDEVITLVKPGYTVKVINWDREGSAKRKEQLSYDVKTINYKAPKGSLTVICFLPAFYYKLMKELRDEELDIIHCTHLILLPIAIIIGTIKRSKIVYDVYEFHSIIFSEKFPFFLQPLCRKIFEFIENRLVRCITLILTMHTSKEMLVHRYKRFNDNVVPLYFVPDLTRSMDIEKLEELRERYKTDRLIVYAGVIIRYKGVMEAIKAISLVKERASNVKLIFIGAFMDDVGEEVNNYLVQAKLKRNVEFTGLLPYEKMLSYLTLSEIGLALYQPIPRYYLLTSGTVRKLYTYMRSSLSIIAPAFGEVGRVVQKEKCGILVDTTDTQAIANAIIYLLEHPKEAHAMGKRGRKAVEMKYNWELEEKKLLKAYRRLEREINKQKPSA